MIRYGLDVNLARISGLPEDSVLGLYFPSKVAALEGRWKKTSLADVKICR